MIGMKVTKHGEWNRLRHDVSSRNVDNTLDNIDKQIGQIAKDIAHQASVDAPILTGYMRLTLKEEYVRKERLTWEVMPDVYGKLPYLWVQNFNHQTYGLFFTWAFNKQHALYEQRLQQNIKRSFK